MLKNEFGVEVGGIGGFDRGVQVLGWLFLPTQPLSTKPFHAPPNPPQKEEGKGAQQTSPPFFRNHSPTPVTKNAHALHHSLSLSLSLFSCIYLPRLFLNYLTFDINITQLHLRLHLHFSLFFSLPSSPLSLSISLSHILCFSL